MQRWHSNNMAFKKFLVLSLLIHIGIITIHIQTSLVIENTPSTILTVYIEHEKPNKAVITSHKIIPETSQLKVVEKKKPEVKKVVIVKKTIAQKKSRTSAIKKSTPFSLDDFSKMVVADVTKKFTKTKQASIIVDTRYNSGIYNSYIKAWQNKIKRIGETLFSTKQEGDVVLIAKIRDDGTLINVRITKKSSEEQLNKNALNMVKLGSPYTKFPNIFQVKTLSIRTIIAFKNKT